MGRPSTTPPYVDLLDKNAVQVAFFLDNFFPSAYRAPSDSGERSSVFAALAHPTEPQRSRDARPGSTRHSGAALPAPAQLAGMRLALFFRIFGMLVTRRRFFRIAG